ncbi:pyrroloquinoline quinone biosynthesis peptide chaperone PqqD (plasmid) [Alloyangia pacifica]|uniref:PqqA binding protein n=1 Tax=Alloyangia pacifica TaxID=311180 RepID=A0A2U8HLH0_9RHOB|nr:MULTISPECIES: pyrroloquinoline quinone biosynthesis peptide chaperone PqqD [Roseobacteraceae]AWI86420.1 pyrroloquinoline quinone biosynthesis peptide chaperone PqqD [Alloyangia pacifica]NDV48713.1 pyrroloquinoline quinone biosynthesis peptide chaperone PqqD [Salipiger sp. PrR003]NDW33661.1 pyrroloquinoline quinone biosynthesis peptide chaperone PqqD [Salipiger sp. PrR007]
MDPAAIPALPRGVRLHHDRVRGGWVLLAPERAVTLDPIAHAILSEVDGTRSLAEITGILAARYAAPPEQIAADAAGFLQALHARRFLDLSP